MRAAVFSGQPLRTPRSRSSAVRPNPIITASERELRETSRCRMNIRLIYRKRKSGALSPYVDVDSLHGVVAEAGKVPGRLHGLRVPSCVRRATGELMLARRGVPGEAPELPAMRMLLGDDGSRAPMTVHTEFHPFDR